MENIQKIIEFKKQRFWSSSVDIEALNEKIFHLNQDGWRVLTVSSAHNMFGLITSYTILVELKK